MIDSNAPGYFHCMVFFCFKYNFLFERMQKSSSENKDNAADFTGIRSGF